MIMLIRRLSGWFLDYWWEEKEGKQRKLGIKLNDYTVRLIKLWNKKTTFKPKMYISCVVLLVA